MASVYTVLTIARSSTILLVNGKSSLSQAPEAPTWENWNMLGTMGSRACPEVMPVSFWSPRTLAGKS